MATATIGKETKENMYQRLVTQGEFTVLDIETTGLSPAKGGFLLEIAAVRISNGRIIAKHSSLIDPLQKLYGKTIELTGITNEMVKGKPTYDKVLPKLAKFMGDSTIVAHNAVFDWNRFLLHYFEKVGIYPKNEVVCTKNFFQFLKPERRKLKLKYGLSELVKEYDVPFDEQNHHRALDDTLATAQAFLSMREEFLGEVFVQEELTKELTETDTTVVEEEKVKDVTIQSVRYWAKKTSQRDLRRIYVRLHHNYKIYGTVYYDIPIKQWFVKEFDAPIDLDAVEEAVLKKIRLASLEDFVTGLGNRFN